MITSAEQASDLGAQRRLRRRRQRTDRRTWRGFCCPWIACIMEDPSRGWNPPRQRYDWPCALQSYSSSCCWWEAPLAGSASKTFPSTRHSTGRSPRFRSGPPLHEAFMMTAFRSLQRVETRLLMGPSFQLPRRSLIAYRRIGYLPNSNLASIQGKKCFLSTRGEASRASEQARSSPYQMA